MSALTNTQDGSTASMEPQRMAWKLEKLLSMAMNSLVSSGMKSISSERALSPGARSALETRKQLIAAALAPAPQREIRVAVAQLFLAFPSSRGAEADMDMQISVYAAELAPFPLWAIAAACKAHMQGRGQGSTDFVPSVAKLAEHIRKVVARHAEEAARITLALEAPVVGPPEPTPEQRAARADRLQACADGLREAISCRVAGEAPGDMTKAEAEARLAAAEPIPRDVLERDLARLMGLKALAQ